MKSCIHMEAGAHRGGRSKPYRTVHVGRSLPRKTTIQLHWPPFDYSSLGGNRLFGKPHFCASWTVSHAIGPKPTEVLIIKELMTSGPAGEIPAGPQVLHRCVHAWAGSASSGFSRSARRDNLIRPVSSTLITLTFTASPIETTSLTFLTNP